MISPGTTVQAATSSGGRPSLPTGKPTGVQSETRGLPEGRRTTTRGRLLAGAGKAPWRGVPASFSGPGREAPSRLGRSSDKARGGSLEAALRVTPGDLGARDLRALRNPWPPRTWPRLSVREAVTPRRSPAAGLWAGQVPALPGLVGHGIDSRPLKRGVDLGLTLAMAPIWLPFLILVAAAVGLTSGAPVLFVQERCGLRGRRFRALKFRTMVVDAEARLETLLRADPDARSEYETYRKLRHDPRVTPVGRFLRKTSLDELPQLLNVLRGDMSLVGPRPYLPRELAGVGPEGGEILAVRPGLTGLWQVTRRNAASFAERLSIDRHYVRSRSVWLDLHLLARTVPAVLAGKGAC